MQRPAAGAVADAGEALLEATEQDDVERDDSERDGAERGDAHRDGSAEVERIDAE